MWQSKWEYTVQLSGLYERLGRQMESRGESMALFSSSDIPEHIFWVMQMSYFVKKNVNAVNILLPEHNINDNWWILHLSYGGNRTHAGAKPHLTRSATLTIGHPSIYDWYPMFPSHVMGTFGTNRIYSVGRMVKVADRMRWGFVPARVRFPLYLECKIHQSDDVLRYSFLCSSSALCNNYRHFPRPYYISSWLIYISLWLM